MIVDELRLLEKRGEWTAVVALYPRITEASRGAFVKALRRTDAVKKALLRPETMDAVVVFRAMKPKDAPLDAALCSGEVAIRREAALAACCVPMHETLVAALIAALDDADRYVRAYAVAALRRVKGPAVMAAFSRRLAVETDAVVADDLAFAA